MMNDVKLRDVDGGWGWVVLAASVISMALQSGLVMAVAMFQIEFLGAFDGSKSYIALIGALTLCGQTLLGPVAGIISSVLSPRITIMIGAALVLLGLVIASFATDLVTLLIFFGIVTGIGNGLMYTPSATIVNNYFDKYRVIANGVTLSAPGIGVLTAPYLVRWLIETQGWRFTMGAAGCIMVQICVLASLFFPHKGAPAGPSCCCSCTCRKVRDAQEVEVALPSNLLKVKDPYENVAKVMVGSRTAMHMSEFGSVMLTSSVLWTVEETFTLRQRLVHLLRRKFMWVMCLNQLLLMAGLSVNTVLFPSYAQSVGIPFSDIPSLYTVYGITMTLSRVTGGFAFSRVPNHLMQVYFGFQVSVTLVIGLLPMWGTSMDALYGYNFLLGVTYGPTFLLVTPILIRHVGLEDLSVAFGGVMLCCGIGYVIAPPLGGLMFDVFGDYRISYHFAGSLIGLATLSLLLLLFIKDQEPPDTKQDPKKQALIPDSSEDTENESSQSSESTNQIPYKKEEMGSVHVIYDVEDLRKFAFDRHS